MAKLYLVGEVRRKHKVTIGGVIPAEIDMKWAPGMIGVMPVFDDKKLAEKYAGDRIIYEIETQKKDKNNEK